MPKLFSGILIKFFKKCNWGPQNLEIAALLCTLGRIRLFPEMMAAEPKRSYCPRCVKYGLRCLAAVLKVVNVNHTECLFIRCSLFVFFGTACLRSPVHVCSRKEQMKVKTLRKSSKMCWKAVIYVCCLFGLVWFLF